MRPARRATGEAQAPRPAKEGQGICPHSARRRVRDEPPPALGAAPTGSSHRVPHELQPTAKIKAARGQAAPSPLQRGRIRPGSAHRIAAARSERLSDELLALGREQPLTVRAVGREGVRLAIVGCRPPQVVETLSAVRRVRRRSNTSAISSLVRSPTVVSLMRPMRSDQSASRCSPGDDKRAGASVVTGHGLRLRGPAPGSCSSAGALVSRPTMTRSAGGRQERFLSALSTSCRR